MQPHFLVRVLEHASEGKTFSAFFEHTGSTCAAQLAANTKMFCNDCDAFVGYFFNRNVD